MPRKRRLLIIGSDIESHERWVIELGERFHIVQAHTLEDAQDILASDTSFASIAIESYEESGELKALPVVRRLRRTYRKPLIGVVTSQAYQKQLADAHQLVLAGCTVFATRFDLPETICAALKLL